MMIDFELSSNVKCLLVAALKYIVVLTLIFVSTDELVAQSSHQSLRKGDRQYDLDNYKESEKHYRTAADLEYSNPIALYNLGNALFQQGDWEDAAERFALAAKYATKVDDQADALSNLGDSFLKLRKFKESVEAYQNSLRLRPGDAGTKMNLQLAKKKLQQEEEQKKQQQQKNQSQSQDSKQDQQSSQQPQNQQDQQQQPQNQPKQDPSGQSQQPEPQPDQPQPGKMKKEEAKRLLETAVGTEDQRNARKYRSAQQQNKKKGDRKDW